MVNNPPPPAPPGAWLTMTDGHMAAIEVKADLGRYCSPVSAGEVIEEAKAQKSRADALAARLAEAIALAEEAVRVCALCEGSYAVVDPDGEEDNCPDCSYYIPPEEVRRRDALAARLATVKEGHGG